MTLRTCAQRVHVSQHDARWQHLLRIQTARIFMYVAMNTKKVVHVYHVQKIWTSNCWTSNCWTSNCWTSNCWTSNCWTSNCSSACGLQVTTHFELEYMQLERHCLSVCLSNVSVLPVRWQLRHSFYLITGNKTYTFVEQINWYSTQIRGPPKGGGGCSPPQTPQNRNLKNTFCRYYIRSFMWFTFQPKSATEIGWWLVH
jgi:hypothetical protein